MRAARVAVVCVCVCVSVRSFLPPRTSRPRNIGMHVVTRHGKKFLLKMLRSESTASFACLRCHQLHLNPNDGQQRNHLKVGEPLIVAILTENALFRGYGTFAYLLCAHIRNINLRRCITSARGHELSGRVRAHAYNYYAWAECAWAHGHELSGRVCIWNLASFLSYLLLHCAYDNYIHTTGLHLEIDPKGGEMSIYEKEGGRNPVYMRC